MFFFIFFDISSLLLRYITPAIPRSSRLDLSKNILKNIDSYLNFRTLVLRQDKNLNFLRDLLSHLIVAPQSYNPGYTHSKRLYLTQNILECFLNLYPDRVLGPKGRTGVGLGVRRRDWECRDLARPARMRVFMFG